MAPRFLTVWQQCCEEGKLPSKETQDFLYDAAMSQLKRHHKREKSAMDLYTAFLNAGNPHVGDETTLECV